MTTRERVDSAIVRKIYDHYAMIDSDIRALYEQISTQLQKAYLQTIQSNLNLYGCQKLASLSDSASIQWIQDKAQTDSEGIARTYNRELLSKINALRAANPKGNRFYYMAGLDSWILQRNTKKVPSISLNTLTQARAYAQDRFIRENNIKGRFAPVGPPPVCKLCIRVFALGPLTWEECQKPRNRFPQHAGCPHKHAAMVITPINCAEAWTG